MLKLPRESGNMNFKKRNSINKTNTQLTTNNNTREKLQHEFLDIRQEGGVIFKGLG
jgi:hypothetical protein